VEFLEFMAVCWTIGILGGMYVAPRWVEAHYRYKQARLGAEQQWLAEAVAPTARRATAVAVLDTDTKGPLHAAQCRCWDCTHGEYGEHQHYGP
jgi:hypothetical protein